MATSVVCDNAAVRGFEPLKLSGNAEIDGERERVRPVLVMRTHTVTIPLREKWKFTTFQLALFSSFDSERNHVPN